MEEVISQLERRPLPKPENIKLNQLYRKPTYDEVIGYIETEPNTLEYPDRQAKFLRNSFELSFLDKFNSEMIEDQQKQLLKYQIAQEKLKELAVQNGTSFATEQAMADLGASQFQTPNTVNSNFQTPATPQRPGWLPPPPPQAEGVMVGGSSNQGLPAQMPGNQPPPPPDAGGVSQQTALAKAKAKAKASPQKFYIGGDDEDTPEWKYPSPQHPLLWLSGLMNQSIDAAGDAASNAFDSGLQYMGSGAASSSNTAPWLTLPSSWWGAASPEQKRS